MADHQCREAAYLDVSLVFGYLLLPLCPCICFSRERTRVPELVDRVSRKGVAGIGAAALNLSQTYHMYACVVREPLPEVTVPWEGVTDSAMAWVLAGA